MLSIETAGGSGLSRYLTNLGRALADALSSVPTAQPAQVAGYWENRDFWIAEFQHLLEALDGYDARLLRMRAAYDQYTSRHGGEHNRDEFRLPRQRVGGGSSGPGRRLATASLARTALKDLAERTLDLRIASRPDNDQFVSQLRITGRETKTR